MRRVHRYSRVARVDLRPSQSVRLRIDRSDGQAALRLPAQHRARGLPCRRGVGRRARTPGARYLHAIGDSYTMGWGVDAAHVVSGAARTAARAGASRAEPRRGRLRGDRRDREVASARRSLSARRRGLSLQPERPRRRRAGGGGGTAQRAVAHGARGARRGPPRELPGGSAVRAALPAAVPGGTGDRDAGRDGSRETGIAAATRAGGAARAAGATRVAGDGHLRRAPLVPRLPGGARGAAAGAGALQPARVAAGAPLLPGAGDRGAPLRRAARAADPGRRTLQCRRQRGRGRPRRARCCGEGRNEAGS